MSPRVTRVEEAMGAYARICAANAAEDGRLAEERRVAREARAADEAHRLRLVRGSRDPGGWDAVAA